jgi:hypothetical protein
MGNSDSRYLAFIEVAKGLIEMDNVEGLKKHLYLDRETIDLFLVEVKWRRMLWKILDDLLTFQENEEKTTVVFTRYFQINNDALIEAHNLLLKKVESNIVLKRLYDLMPAPRGDFRKEFRKKIFRTWDFDRIDTLYFTGGEDDLVNILSYSIETQQFSSEQGEVVRKWCKKYKNTRWLEEMLPKCQSLPLKANLVVEFLRTCGYDYDPQQLLLEAILPRRNLWDENHAIHNAMYWFIVTITNSEPLKPELLAALQPYYQQILLNQVKFHSEKHEDRVKMILVFCVLEGVMMDDSTLRYVLECPRYRDVTLSNAYLTESQFNMINEKIASIQEIAKGRELTPVEQDDVRELIQVIARRTQEITLPPYEEE